MESHSKSNNFPERSQPRPPETQQQMSWIATGMAPQTSRRKKVKIDKYEKVHYSNPGVGGL